MNAKINKYMYASIFSSLTGNVCWLVRVWFMLPMAEFAT